MKIRSNGKLRVLVKNSREGQNRQMYYNLAVLIDGEAGNMSCTEEAHYNAVEDQINDVVFEYNSEFKSFRIIDAHPTLDDGHLFKTSNKSDTEADKSGTKADKSAK